MGGGNNGIYVYHHCFHDTIQIQRRKISAYNVCTQ